MTRLIRLFKSFFRGWPFALKSTVRKLEIEKITLLDALRNANAELRKHRSAMASLRDASPTLMDRLFPAKDL